MFPISIMRTTFNLCRFVLIFYLNFICMKALFGQHNGMVVQSKNNIIDFSNPTPMVVNGDFHYLSEWTYGASLCDEDGKLLIYSDGVNFYNRNGKLIENGLGYASRAELQNCIGWGNLIGNLFINDLDSTIFHLISKRTTSTSKNYFYYSRFHKINNDSFIYQVKDSILGPVFSGYFRAVRHSNGIDTWLFLPTDTSIRLYLISQGKLTLTGEFKLDK